MQELESQYFGEFKWKQTHMKLICDSFEIFEAAKKAVIHSRSLLEDYILAHPTFQTSMEPIAIDLNAPEFIRSMMQAGLIAGVGPMASVAGGLAEIATNAMVIKKSKAALVENGGDISIKGVKAMAIGVYAGENRMAKQIGFKIKAHDLPIGICTSAGQVGHSISLGSADAVIIFSGSAFLSDASATAVANYVKKNDPEGSIQQALEKAEDIEGVNGCLAISGELVGYTGKIPEMVEVLDSEV